MGQRLKQRVANTLRQFQRFAIQPTGAPQVSVNNRQVGKRRQAHQTLAITPLRQTFQGLTAVALGQFAVTPTPRNNPAQRQPLSEHRLLRSGRRRRQKAAEVAG